MKKSAAIIGGLALITIGIGIGWALSAGRSSPTPAVPTPAIPPDGSLFLFPSPIPGATEKNPVITLRCEVRDDVTGDLVIAEEVRLGNAPGQGQVVHRDVAVFEVTVPGRITGDYLYLSVVARGYHLWSVGLRHNLNHSRVLPLPVNLEPLPATPAPQAMVSEQ